jgi:hypothetical protein
VPNDSPATRRAAERRFPSSRPDLCFFQYFLTETELSACLRDAGFTVLESGVLPSASVRLLAPAVASGLNGPGFRVADSIVYTMLSWVPRYCVMRYAVATPASAPAHLDNALGGN